MPYSRAMKEVTLKGMDARRVCMLEREREGERMRERMKGARQDSECVREKESTTRQEMREKYTPNCSALNAPPPPLSLQRYRHRESPPKVCWHIFCRFCRCMDVVTSLHFIAIFSVKEEIFHDVLDDDDGSIPVPHWHFCCLRMDETYRRWDTSS
jgi:hypothetical protein